MKDNKTLQVLAGIVLVVLALFLSAKTRNAFAERDYIGKAVRDRDTITVSGEGKIAAQPDLARISLGVQTDGATVKEVQQKNTEKMNAIIAAVKGMGIVEKDIQTSNYSLQPKIDWANGKQNVIGYTASQQVTVKVRDLNKAGDVLAKAGELGANQIGSLSFTVDDPSNLQDQARIKAIKDAKKKAEMLADSIGLHLVKVVSFSENGGGMPVPTPMLYRSDMGMVAEKAVAPQVEAGSLDVTSDVSVTFEVR